MWKRVVWLCVLWPATALAQGAPAPLGANDPTRALPPPPSASSTLDTARPAEGAPASANGEERFVLSEAVFDGAASLDAAALRPAWAAQVAQPVSLADLRAIAARAEEIYADHGHPFVAIVLAAPQRVENGVVHFKVVEGRISDLTVLGADPAARRQAAAVLAPLVDKQPLTIGDVEAAYEASKNVPGLAVAGALRRGSKPGGMDLVVQASRRSWRVYGNVNNLYADPVGPWGALVGVDYFGKSRYGDQTSVQLYSTLEWGEQKMLRASHSRRLTASGLTLSLTGLVADADPQGAVAPLDLATSVVSGRVELSQPLWLRRSGFLTLSGALDVSDQETKVFSKVQLSEDRLRVASLTLAGELHNETARLAYSTELRKGLDVWDASDPGDKRLSRTGADPQAWVVKARAEGEVAVHPKLRFNLRLEGQRSEDSLTAPEEYSVGNLSIGRGYEPGSGFGDSAAGASVEARFGPWPVARRVSAQPFIFYDAVKLWNEDPGGVNGRTLQSAGAGVRFELPGRLRLDVTYAEPLRAPLGVGDHVPQPRVLVNLTAGLDDTFESLRRAFSRLGTRR